MPKIQSLSEILEENRILQESRGRSHHWNHAFNHLLKERSLIIELDDKNYSVVDTIRHIFSENGQKKFIHLNPAEGEANVAIALNGGNGVVSKIIPNEFSDQLPDITDSGGVGRAPLLLPSIKSRFVKGNDPIAPFRLKFYPYIDDTSVSPKDVEKFRTVMKERYGLDIKDGDEKPINLRRLPDKDRTLCAIDADMFTIVDADKFRASKEEILKWVAYVAEVFPVYKTKDMPRQGEGFEFNERCLISSVIAKKLSFEEFRLQDDTKGFVERLGCEDSQNKARAGKPSGGWLDRQLHNIGWRR